MEGGIDKQKPLGLCCVAQRQVTPAQQLAQLMEWLQAMAAQLPGADGLSETQRAEQAEARNAEVLVV